MVQEARKKKRDYLDMDCQIQEVTEENYPYKGHLFCAKCGSLLTHRIYSNGNRMSWDCSGRTRHGKDFCDGIHVPDTAVRQWQFDGNIYISVKDSRKSIKEFSYTKESSWSRRHKKKEFVRDVPELTEENYPYYRSIFCACGIRACNVRYAWRTAPNTACVGSVRRRRVNGRKYRSISTEGLCGCGQK